MRNKVDNFKREDVIAFANAYLKSNKITEETNEVFHYICAFLLQANSYRGFNWYCERQLENYKMVSVCCGQDLADYIQLY